MKYMILFLTLFISTVLSSQNMTKGKIDTYDLDNYHIYNCKVTWINIFETNLSAKEIKKAVELKNITNFKEFDDKTLTLDILLIIIGSLMLLVGLAGCLLPILPGPPLSWLGLVVLKFSSSFTEVLSWREVLLWGALVVIVTLIDTVLPVLGSRKIF